MSRDVFMNCIFPLLSSRRHQDVYSFGKTCKLYYGYAKKYLDDLAKKHFQQPTASYIWLRCAHNIQRSEGKTLSYGYAGGLARKTTLAKMFNFPVGWFKEVPPYKQQRYWSQAKQKWQHRDLWNFQQGLSLCIRKYGGDFQRYRRFRRVQLSEIEITDKKRKVGHEINRLKRRITEYENAIQCMKRKKRHLEDKNE